MNYDTNVVISYNIIKYILLGLFIHKYPTIRMMKCFIKDLYSIQPENLTSMVV